MNKYNEYMSHIEVTDEMKRRVLAGVSKAIEEQKEEAGAKTVVTPMPIKKRHISIVPLISIAATVLIVGGIAVLFVSGYLDSGKSKKVKNNDATPAATVTKNVDGAFAEGADSVSYDSADFDSDSADEECETVCDYGAEEPGVDSGFTEETLPATSSTFKNPDVGDEDIHNLIPAASYETIASDDNGTLIYSFNTGSNSALVYVAKDDTDLPAMYLEGYNTDGTLTANGVTANGINYALFNTGYAEGSYNAATFVNDGQSYLIVFEEPVPEESLREVIAGY